MPKTPEKNTPKDIDKSNNKRHDRNIERIERDTRSNKPLFKIKNISKKEDKKMENKVPQKIFQRRYILGYPDGTFHPDNGLTRAEAASIFAKLLNLNLDNNEKPNFRDTNSDWYNAQINAVVKAGLMKGYNNGKFMPNKEITRAEFSQIISQINKNVKETKVATDITGHWAEHVITKALGSGALENYENGEFKPNQKITRAEAVNIFMILSLLLIIYK